MISPEIHILVLHSHTTRTFVAESFDMEIGKSKNTRIFQAVHYLKVSWILLLRHQTGQWGTQFQWGTQLESAKGFEFESRQGKLETDFDR